MSEQPGRYQRSPNALIGALLVILVVIVGFVALRSFSRGNQDVAVPTVDYAGAARQARSEGLVTAAAPDPMPKGWRATSVRYSGRPDPSWHVGILTSEQTYVGIEEADATASALATRYLGKGAERAGTMRVGSGTWTAWRGSDGYGLTRRTDRDTLFVGGPAGKRAVVELTGRLRSG